MPKLTLQPSGKVIEIDSDKSLMEAIREQNIYIKSSCGGVASCSDCIIKVVSGTDNLTEPPFEEIKLLGNVFHITKERLSCQTKLMGDACIDISAHDKGSDEEKMRQKTTHFQKKKTVLKRTPEEREQIIQERKEKAHQKNIEAGPKQGGFSRPKDKFRK
jgi:2Fe-2S ferredoxin